MILCCMTAVFTACSEIDEGERYELLPTVEPKRAVLLEEFTGQFCPNCPDAHRQITSLKEQYGESLIAVSIHAGEQAIAAPMGLMQPEGNEYANRWNVKMYPQGILNRRSGLLDHPAWAGEIYKAVQEDAPVSISLNAQLEENEDGGGTIRISTEMLPFSDVSGKLQLWITESGIKAIQDDHGLKLIDYEHNHVFRACVNGTWGEDIELPANVYHTLEHTIALQDAWNKDNISVVAFIYNDNGVLQAAECKVNLINNENI